MGDSTKAESVTASEQLVVRYSIWDLARLKKGLYLLIKRTFDIVSSSLGLIVASPIMLATAAIVRLGDGGPAIYKQTRIGKGGKEFTIYKFRSMRIDADARLAEMLKNDPLVAEEYAKNAKLKDDPRITKVGKFIRKTSIDELPQLINILKGDMSVVGNRPYMISERSKMGPVYTNIVSTRPGLTGYWQVSGRNDQTFKKRLELESFYSNNASIRMDVRIFIKTFSAVIGAKGAE